MPKYLFGILFQRIDVMKFDQGHFQGEKYSSLLGLLIW